jgi:hypothetical protein
VILEPDDELEEPEKHESVVADDCGLVLSFICTYGPSNQSDYVCCLIKSCICIRWSSYS